MSDTRNDMKLYTVCIEMVCVIDEIHDGICSQNDFIVQQKLSQVLKIIQSEVQQILSVNNEEEQQLWMDVLAQLLSAQEQEDYSRIDDAVYKLKNMIIGIIFRYQQCGIHEPIEEEKLATISDDYILFDSQMGKYALKVHTKTCDHQLCSSYDPYEEGMQIARTAYQQAVKTDIYGIKQLHIVGLGLGYHVLALSKYADISDIFVYETDRNIIQIALTVQPKLNKNTKVHIVEDEKLEYFSRVIDKNENIFIYRPAIKTIKNLQLRNILQNYYMKTSGMYYQNGILRYNFSRNVQLQSSNVEILKKHFTGNWCILIAGGPSLDEQIEELRKIQCSKAPVILIAVGTVLKKLIHNQIYPDYVVITDAKEGMIRQIQDIDTKKCKTNLLYLSTAAWEVSYAWKGEKYIIYQKDFEPAESIGTHLLVETGGSVSMTAFDLCLQFDCKGIIAAGLDLAFYQNHSHASDTAGQRNVTDTGIYVESVTGEQIMTSRNLLSYKEWIEYRIQKRSAQELKIRLINSSKGALISGMENISLSEILGQIIKE